MDRETRREKVIEAKNREIRLKMKSLRVNVDSEIMNDPSKSNNREDSKQNVLSTKDALIEQCEQDYINIIEAVRILYFTLTLHHFLICFNILLVYDAT